jgi:methylthioribose-1-phosphate isomerase
MIQASDIKKLREATGAGILDCKKALEQSEGDYDKAYRTIREQGKSKAEKKSDRIAANGDVANKIGTYGLAVLAHAHGIPMYVAAPTSTIDLRIADGSMIPIEERSSDEVTMIQGIRIAPAGVIAAHPAFDVTPARYISGIICEKVVIRAPYGPGLAAMC